MTHEGILRIIYPNKQTPSLLDKMTQLWYRRKPSSSLTTMPVFSHLHVLFRVSFSSAFYKIAWMKIHHNLVKKLQVFFCLPADAAFLLGYILCFQRSLYLPVYYWRRISHKLSDCVQISVLSNDNWFSLTSCIKMFYTRLPCVFKHFCSFTCSLWHINCCYLPTPQSHILTNWTLTIAPVDRNETA